MAKDGNDTGDRVAPPSWEEVAEYFESRRIVDHDLEADAFLLYWDEKNWETKNGPIKSWKRNAATWAKNARRYTRRDESPGLQVQSAGRDHRADGGSLSRSQQGRASNADLARIYGISEAASDRGGRPVGGGADEGRLLNGTADRG